MGLKELRQLDKGGKSDRKKECPISQLWTQSWEMDTAHLPREPAKCVAGYLLCVFGPHMVGSSKLEILLIGEGPQGSVFS